MEHLIDLNHQNKEKHYEWNNINANNPKYFK